MMATRIVLLLLGTTIASCFTLRNDVLCENNKIPSILDARIPPFTLPFIQQGTNLFYKPQFMSPGAVVQSPIPFQTQPIKPEQPQIIIEQSAYIPEPPGAIEPEQIEAVQNTPLDIPEPPNLSPLLMPEPQNDLYEEHPVIEPIVVEGSEEPYKPIVIPDPPKLTPLPELSIPTNVEIKPENIPDIMNPEQNPFIPEAPIPPPFTTPELPIISVVSDIQPSSEQKPVKIPESPILAPITSENTACDDDSLAIPEAPVLPPFSKPAIAQEVPDLPTIPLEIPAELEPTPQKPVEIPEAPVLPPFTTPDLPIVPVFPESPIEVQPTSEQKPIVIPEAPVLPPFSISEGSIVAPIASEAVQPADEYVPNGIPEAPVLPPLTIPEQPIIPVFPEIQPVPVPQPFNDPTCNDISEISKSKRPEIPEAPILPPYTIAELPMVVPVDSEIPKEVQQAEEYKLIEIPEAPVLPPYTMRELQEKPVVVEIMPASEKKHEKYPEAPVLPPFFMSELPKVQIPLIPEVSIPELKPIELPAAPILPPVSSDFSKISPDSESTPMHIPEAPTLPPFTETQVDIIRPADLPRLPEIYEAKPISQVKFEIPAPPKLQELEIPLISEYAPSLVPLPSTPTEVEYQPFAKIPEAPQLPPVRMPDISSVIFKEPTQYVPQQIKTEEKAAEPCLDNLSSNVLSLHGAQLTQPTFWAQNIIIERVLPNLIYGDKHHAKTLDERIMYPVSPNDVEYAQ